MKKVFITGVAGVGKSTISRTLSDLGFQAYDIEADEHGLFMFIRNDTGECYVDYDPADMKKVDNASWICDISKFKKLLNEQAGDIAFYCGIATNNLEIMSLCDMSILLKASRETIYNRLLPREGTDDFANTEEGRQRHLIWKDEFEQEMINAHMIVVDANPSPEEIAKNIVNLCRH